MMLNRAWQILTTLCLCCISVLLLGGVAVAQQVPTSLPSKEAIDAYLSYTSRPAYSAFAISPAGGFGASWSYGLISAADEAALEKCQARSPHAPCEVISRDGESLQETVDIAALKQQLHLAREHIWPQVEPNKVAMQISNNLVQSKAYQKYLQATGQKAFAAAFGGAWGYSANHVNAYQAQQAALEQCQSFAQGQHRCQVIDVNQVATMGRLDSTLLGQKKEFAPLRLPQNAQADPSIRALAAEIIGEKWDSYQQAGRFKAYAANQFGATGLADDHATAEVAEEAALLACENLNQLRRANPLMKHKVAPCLVIAVNNDFDEHNIKLLLDYQHSGAALHQ